jgi:hypothetical protein
VLYVRLAPQKVKVSLSVPLKASFEQKNKTSSKRWRGVLDKDHPRTYQGSNKECLCVDLGGSGKEQKSIGMERGLGQKPLTDAFC